MAKEVKQASRRRRKSYDMLFGDQATAGLGKSLSSQTLLQCTWHACCCISHASALTCTRGNKRNNCYVSYLLAALVCTGQHKRSASPIELDGHLVVENLLQPLILQAVIHDCIA